MVSTGDYTTSTWIVGDCQNHRNTLWESLSTNQYNTGFLTKIGEYGNFLSHEGTPSHHPVVMDDHDATPLRFVLADQEAAPSIQE